MVGDLLRPQLEELSNQWRRRPMPSLEDINKDLCKNAVRLRLQNIAAQIEELDFLQREARNSQDLDSDRHYTQMVDLRKQQRNKLEYASDALSLMGKRRAEAERYGQGV